jgi:hypothetical protein
MASAAEREHHGAMMEQTPPPTRIDAPQRTRIRDLRQQIEERDETIRLLNEALSRALDELERGGKLAA